MRIHVYGGNAAQFNADIEFDGVFILYIFEYYAYVHNKRGDWRKNNKICLESGFSRSTHISYPTRLYIGIYYIICVPIRYICVCIYIRVLLLLLLFYEKWNPKRKAQYVSLHNSVLLITLPTTLILCVSFDVLVFYTPDGMRARE